MATVKAWAVVCKSEVHEVCLIERNAREELAWLRRYAKDYECGPHSVVLLTGTLPKRRKAKR